ncbi:MAG: hypothetical protein DWQ58_23145 [Microcystis aeruginosa TA09]|nr:MAG: hypothetical protein DWQ58_23145 [Microcystis aeruginosa TA09]
MVVFGGIVLKVIPPIFGICQLFVELLLILNPLSNAQKTGFSEKPVFYSCTHAKRGINNQSLITRFSITSDFITQSQLLGVLLANITITY